MSSNKKIFKNSLFLYLRMLFSLGIGLYTSRLLLEVMGVSDFGIFNVVAGVVLIVAFLKSNLSSASLRFINVSIADNNILNSIKVFNNILILHLLFAIVILIISETIGLWFLNNGLNIPANRMLSVNIVYQFSIFSVIFSILSLPFNSIIIAKEKINIYAYLSIAELLLKLLAVFVLYLNLGNNMVIYSTLLTLISIIILSLNIFLAKRFPEIKVNFKYNSSLLKEIGSFFGWDLYGNLSFIASTQGLSMIHNVFFGPIINAATAIVSQAQGGIGSIAANVTFAIRPQLTNSYVKKDFIRMEELLFKGTRYSFFLMLLLVVPCYYNAEFLFSLWLKETPEYVVHFFKISLISVLISCSFGQLGYLIHATGKMAKISFYSGTIFLLSLCLNYILYRNGFPPQTSYYVGIGTVLLVGCNNLMIVKQNIPEFNFKSYLVNVLLKIYSITLLCFLISYYLISSSIILNMISPFVIIFLLILFIGLDRKEKQSAFIFAKNFTKSFKS